MNWEAVGALGEVGGAVAVVGSLVYLATQIRQGSAAIRTNAHQEAVRVSSEILIRSCESEIHDLIVRATLDWESLPAEERTRFHNYANAGFNYYEALFYAHRAGNVEGEIWEARLERMRAVFALEGFQSAWEERKSGFGKSFRDFVAREVVTSPTDQFASARDRALADRARDREGADP